jgi:uncharacterized protein DUF6582
MAKTLSTKDRKKLSKKSFALPGKRKYPIPDKSHARNALSRVAQNGSPEEEKKVRSAVFKRFPGLRKKKKDDTGSSAKSRPSSGSAKRTGRRGEKKSKKS